VKISVVDETDGCVFEFFDDLLHGISSRNYSALVNTEQSWD
jgi:hypothetical protein